VEKIAVGRQLCKSSSVRINGAAKVNVIKESKAGVDHSQLTVPVMTRMRVEESLCFAVTLLLFHAPSDPGPSGNVPLLRLKLTLNAAIH